MVTYTSLLVHQTADQYVRHNVRRVGRNSTKVFDRTRWRRQTLDPYADEQQLQGGLLTWACSRCIGGKTWSVHGPATAAAPVGG